MRGRTYTASQKEQVKKQLLSGLSYKDITNKYGIPKSTVSTWFGNSLPSSTKRARDSHLADIRKIAYEILKQKWKDVHRNETQLIQERVRSELSDIQTEDVGFLKGMLAMLYWAEGRKGWSGMRFANSDPNLSILYLDLLRKCFPIDESKLRVELYVHHYHQIHKARLFWSNLLSIPLKQFNKVYLKKRGEKKRFRKNVAGICFIYYGDSKLRKELLELGLALKNKIVGTRP